jgi:hypothetical protein
MVPPAALAVMLLALAKPLTVGGKLSIAKLTALTMTAAVAAGVSVETFRAGHPSPVAVHSNAVPGHFLAAGAKIPPGIAIVRRAVAFSGTRDVALGCPAGMRLADLLPPHGGRISASYAPGTAAGTDRAGRIRLTGTGAASVTVTALCRRPDARGSIASASRVGAAPAVSAVRVATDLHRAPGSTRLVGSVRRGQPVAVRSRAHGWVHVLTDTGATGWVPASVL